MVGGAAGLCQELHRADAGFCVDLGLGSRIPGLIRQVAVIRFVVGKCFKKKGATGSDAPQRDLQVGKATNPPRF